MRTFFNKTVLSAVIIATLFACTKDVKDAQLITADGTLTAVTARGQADQKPENTPPQKPVLTATQDPGPASVGKTVKITYTATNPVTNANVGCGRIFIYQWINTEWKEVASADAPSASFEFTPSTATDCSYKFRAGYSPGGGTVKCDKENKYTGVEYLEGSEYCVDVKDCVQSFTITGDVVEAKPVENGQYEFTIAYTLTSPVDISGVSFQGGATAGGKEGSSISELGNTVMVRHENNKNYVLIWAGNLKACTPQKVWFKYRRNFICPATAEQVTGKWTASVTGTDTEYYIEPLTYTCNQ